MKSSANKITTINGAAAVSIHSIDEIEAQCALLRLPGLKKYLRENQNSVEFIGLGHMDLVYHLLHAEISSRHSKRYTRLRREAFLPSALRIHELQDRLSSLKLSTGVMDMLVSGSWCAESAVLLTGKSGTGKTDFICGMLDGMAFNGLKVRYFDCSMLMMLLTTLYSNGNIEAYRHELEELCRNKAVALDDVCGAQKRQGEENCFKDMLDAMHQSGTGLILASQTPVEQWHSWFGGGTVADAVMDRIMRNALQVKFDGDSKRSRPVKLLGGSDE